LPEAGFGALANEAEVKNKLLRRKDLWRRWQRRDGPFRQPPESSWLLHPAALRMAKRRLLPHRAPRLLHPTTDDRGDPDAPLV
jgi:hypothetical protein